MNRNSITRSFVGFSLITPAIAISIFFIQFYKVHQNDLSPWKGGGFGMFSTIDAPKSRYLKVFLRVEGKYLPITLGGEFTKLATALRVEPTAQNMRVLLKKVATSSWFFTNRFRTKDPKANIESPNLRPVIRPKRKDTWLSDSKKLVHFDRVLIEVWRYRYSTKTKRLSASFISKSEMARP